MQGLRKVYKVLDPGMDLSFASGSDCYSWAACGPDANYRGGFNINLGGTGFVMIDTIITPDGWGNSMYVQNCKEFSSNQ